MTEQTIQLDLTLVAPAITDERDDCWIQLITQLQTLRGVQKVHLLTDQSPAQLCLHYDPNLVTLAQVERMATESGTAFADRYQHEQIAFVGMDAADSAETLAATLNQLDGMLHASVNYAAGLAFVAYDRTRLQRTIIFNAIRSMGVRFPTGEAVEHVHDHAQDDEHDHDHGDHVHNDDDDHAHDDHAGHGHGAVPQFLPHWMQERWTLILVGLAGIFLLLGFLGERFFGFSPTVSTFFYILAYIAGGYDVATHAIPALLKGKFDTDVLMLAAALGAAILGEFGEGAFLLWLFALGHAGEHYALDRARNAVNALGELMPNVAQKKSVNGIIEVPVEQLQIDDVVVVRPGDRVPVDGAVERGSSNIDQSPITGESVPVKKNAGDEVFAGTINQDQALDVRVTRLAKDNTLARVMQLVAEAQGQQSPTQQFTQRFTSRFVPAVLIITLLVIVLPPLFGWMELRDSFYRAMLLLVAASPCALAIGTPASVLSGIARAARNGVLIKGGVHLENLGRSQVMAFDKTGTLTAGEFGVTDTVTFNGISERDLLRIVGSVEQQSNHPLAKAVVEYVEREGVEMGNADALTNIPGRGIESALDGKTVQIGNWKLFAENPDHPQDQDVRETIERLEQSGRTTMAVSYDNQFIGVLGMADTPRPQAKATLAQLRNLGVKHLVMLTGDNDDVAQQVGKELGLTDIRAELLPEQKLEAIRELEAEYGEIAMTGDGVNDAPALTTATVGIAMGGAGTAVALETADIALMADDLSKLPFAVGLSRASRRNIQQNIAISLGVIALLIVTSVTGLIQLSGAVILHEGSTIIVVLNALRLLGYQLRE